MVGNSYSKYIDIVFRGMGDKEVKKQVEMLIKELRYLHKEAQKGLDFSLKINNKEAEKVYANIINKSAQTLGSFGDVDGIDDFTDALKVLSPIVSDTSIKIKTLNKNFINPNLKNSINDFKRLNNQYKNLTLTTKGLLKAKEELKHTNAYKNIENALPIIEKEEKQISRLIEIYNNLLRTQKEYEQKGETDKYNKVTRELSEINRQLEIASDKYRDLALTVKENRIDLGNIKIPKDIVQQNYNTIKRDANRIKIEAQKGLSYATIRKDAVAMQRYKNIIEQVDKALNLETHSVESTIVATTKLTKVVGVTSIRLKDLNRNFINPSIKDYTQTIHNLKNKYDSLTFSVEKQAIAQKKWASNESLTQAQNIIASIKNREVALHKLESRYEKLIKLRDTYYTSGRIAMANRAEVAIRKTTKAIDAEAQTFVKLRNNAREAKEALTNIPRGKWAVETGKRALTYAGIYGGLYEVVNATKRAIEYTNQYDTTVRTLQAVLGMFPAEAKQNADALLTLGQVYGGTAEEISKIAFELGRAGMKNSEIKDATEIVIQMATLTADSYEVATSALVSFNEVFGESVAATYPMEDRLTVIGNKLAAVANDSRMTTQDIGTFANYALAMSKQVGLSIDMVGALAVAFNNAGNNASTIGTMIRRLGTVLKSEKTNVKEFFNNLGIDREQLLHNLLQGGDVAKQAFTNFVKTLGNVPEEEMLKLTAKLDVLAGTTIAGIANNSEAIIQELIRLMKVTNGELSNAKTIADSNKRTWERFKNVLGEVSKNLLATPLAIGSEALKGLMGDAGKDIEATKERVHKLVQVLSFATQTAVTFASVLGVFKLFKFLNVRLGLKAVVAEMRMAVGFTGKMRAGFAALGSTPWLIGITLALEGVMYLVGKNIEKQQLLQDALNTTIKRFRELNRENKDIIIKVNTNQLNKDIEELNKKKNDLKRILDWENSGEISGVSNETKAKLVEEIQKLQESVDKRKEQLRLFNQEIQRQEELNQKIHQQNSYLVENNNRVLEETNLTADLTGGFYNAMIQAGTVGDAVFNINSQLVSSISLAYSFGDALGQSLGNLKRDMAIIQGMSVTNANKKAIEYQLQGITDKYAKLRNAHSDIVGLADKLIANDKIKQSDIDALNLTKAKKEALTEIIKTQAKSVSLQRKYIELDKQANKEAEDKIKRHKDLNFELKKYNNLLHSSVKFGRYDAAIKNAKLALEKIKSQKFDSGEEKQLALVKAQYNLKQQIEAKEKAIEAAKKRGNSASSRALKHQKALARQAEVRHNKETEINSVLEKRKSIQKQIDDLKKNWWVFDKDSVKSAKEKLDLAHKQALALKTNSNKIKYEKAITKEYQARLKLLEAEHNKLKEIYDIFKDGIGNVLKGDISGGFSSIWSGFSDMLIKPFQKQISSYLTQSIAPIMSGLSPMMSGLLGGSSMAMGVTGFAIEMGVKAISSMFSNKLSQAEIDKATGKNKFDSQYFTKSVELWTKYAQEGNSIAVEQLARLKSMDKSLQSFGKGLSSSKNGFRLDGGDMSESHSKGFLGFSESTTTPLGSGIEIATQSVEQLTNSISALGYQSYQVQESSFFGLFSSESIDVEHRALSGSMTKALQDVANNTLDSVARDLETLGFDGTKFREAIQKQVVEMGKINFKDITDPAQQMEVLKNGMSEMFSGATLTALGNFADPQMLNNLLAWQQAGEDIITTTGRVAVGFDQVGVYFDFFGQKLTDFNQSEELIKAAGGLDALTSGLNTFIHNFFSSDEQKQFLQMQLQNALAVYNVALPASKEQFKALVLETQAKITSTKAQIQALKAEIAAKVKAGEISLAVAYGEVKGKADAANQYAYVAGQWGKSSNYLISSANNAGEAVVGFGNNLHRTVEGIATGTASAFQAGAESAVDSAGEIDYSKITSPAIQALESQLGQLDGLYGTLMSQMSGFSSYYNDAGSSISSAGNAASDAGSKFDDLTKSLISIAQLKADWGGDSVKGAELVLEATKKVTGLTYLTYDNFLSEFEKLTADGNGLSDDVLQKWQDMSSALKNLHDVQQKQIEDNIKLQRSIEDILNSFSNLSSLDTANIQLQRSIEDLKRAYDGALDNVEIDSKNFVDLFKQYSNDTTQEQVDKWKNVADALKNVNTEQDKLIDFYKKLTTSFTIIYDSYAFIVGMTISKQKALLMADGAGGMDNLTSSLNTFVDKFLEPYEKVKLDLRNLEEEFYDLGIVMPKNNEEFKKLIQNWSDFSEEGSILYGKVISLSGAFADLSSELTDLINKSKDTLLNNFNEIGDINSQIIDKNKTIADLQYKIWLEQNGITEERLNQLEQERDSIIQTKETLLDLAQSIRDKFILTTDDIFTQSLNSIINDFKNSNYENVNDFTNNVNKYVDDLSKRFAGADYKHELAKTANKVEALPKMLTNEEILNQEIERIKYLLEDTQDTLEDQLKTAQDELLQLKANKTELVLQSQNEINTLEKLLGNDSVLVSVLQNGLTSLSTTLNNLGDDYKQQIDSLTSTINVTDIPTTVDTIIDNAGVTVATNISDTVTGIYEQVLGRDPDEGAVYWDNELNNYSSTEDLATAIAQSALSYTGSTSSVTDEAILRSQINAANYLAQTTTDNSDIIDKLDELKQELNEIKENTSATVDNTQDSMYVA